MIYILSLFFLFHRVLLGRVSILERCLANNLHSSNISTILETSGLDTSSVTSNISTILETSGLDTSSVTALASSLLMDGYEAPSENLYSVDGEEILKHQSVLKVLEKKKESEISSIPSTQEINKITICDKNNDSTENFSTLKSREINSNKESCKENKNRTLLKNNIKEKSLDSKEIEPETIIDKTFTELDKNKVDIIQNDGNHSNIQKTNSLIKENDNKEEKTMKHNESNNHQESSMNDLEDDKTDKPTTGTVFPNSVSDYDKESQYSSKIFEEIVPLHKFDSYMKKVREENASKIREKPKEKLPNNETYFETLSSQTNISFPKNYNSNSESKGDRTQYIEKSNITPKKQSLEINVKKDEKEQNLSPTNESKDNTDTLNASNLPHSTEPNNDHLNETKSQYDNDFDMFYNDSLSLQSTETLHREEEEKFHLDLSDYESDDENFEATLSDWHKQCLLSNKN